jgi:hypothetical protein
MIFNGFKEGSLEERDSEVSGCICPTQPRKDK